MIFIPGYGLDGGKCALLREDEYEIAREFGFDVKPEQPGGTYVTGSRDKLEKLSKAINERRQKAFTEAKAKKKKALLDADAVRTAEILSKYVLEAVSPEMVYEYAIVRDNTLMISKPMMAALNTDIFVPDLRINDLYTTFANYFEVLQVLGAAGFAIATSNGAQAVLMKKMAAGSLSAKAVTSNEKTDEKTEK